MKYSYGFEFDDRAPIQYDLVLDSDSFLLKTAVSDPLPEWTALQYEQCPNCRLSSDQRSRCPIAENLVPIIADWRDIQSYSGVKVTVVSADRTVVVDTTAQQALSSLLGLVMATSACPHTTFFRPMAYFHLPFANQQETLIRSASSLLLVQYFLSLSGGEQNFSLDQLSEIYENIRIVNEGLSKRIQTLETADASPNALVILHLLSFRVPFSFKQSFEDLKKLFRPVVAMLEENRRLDAEQEPAATE